MGHRASSTKGAKGLKGSAQGSAKGTPTKRASHSATATPRSEGKTLPPTPAPAAPAPDQPATPTAPTGTVTPSTGSSDEAGPAELHTVELARVSAFVEAPQDNTERALRPGLPTYPPYQPQPVSPARLPPAPPPTPSSAPASAVASPSRTPAPLPERPMPHMANFYAVIADLADVEHRYVSYTLSEPEARWEHEYVSARTLSGLRAVTVSPDEMDPDDGNESVDEDPRSPVSRLPPIHEGRRAQ